MRVDGEGSGLLVDLKNEEEKKEKREEEKQIYEECVSDPVRNQPRSA